MTSTEFQIHQLRLDKIIYACEAAAANLSAIVAVNLAIYLRLPRIYIVGPAVLALIYTLYVFLSNFSRLQQIKKLESRLYRSI